MAQKEKLKQKIRSIEVARENVNVEGKKIMTFEEKITKCMFVNVKNRGESPVVRWIEDLEFFFFL